MTEPTENPSLLPEGSAPKKPARRKSTSSPAPRKKRAVKSADAEAPAIEKTEAEPTKKPRAPRKKAVKIVSEPETAAPTETVAPVAETPAPVVIAPEPVVVAPVAPAAAPEVAPVVSELQISRDTQDSRDPRDARGNRDERGRRGRGQRGRSRSQERQPQPPRGPQQPVMPQAPSYAGAVAEEWSPGSRSSTPSPSRPESAPQPAATPVSPPVAPVRPAPPEELIIPRRDRSIPQQPQMSREERIAAARQQFNVSEPPIQSAQVSTYQQQQPLAPLPEEPRGEPVFAEGIVEVSGKGFGFLRDPKRSFAQHPSDVFVTPEVCRRYNLRDGVWIRGEIRRGNRGPQLYRLTEIEGEDPEKINNLPMFDELTTINPNHFIKLETDPERFTTRVVDLMAPIGRGQRGLIVAPPRTGKTTFLQHIAEAVVQNHPDMKLIILLVDERPEEVTELRRAIPQAELMASSNDQDLKSHTRIAQLAIERARRLVEMGKHVFILLDSITRVGRAFNNAMANGGRTMSGGVDARALEIPRKLFASARNTEEAGSLTIIATALIETGSRMDELIFQEFKGTGNMELVLDRKISDLRIYPAVDIFMSGTRREELLLPEADLHKINIIRRGLSGHKPAEAIERLLFFLKKFPTNAQMLREIPG